MLEGFKKLLGQAGKIAGQAVSGAVNEAKRNPLQTLIGIPAGGVAGVAGQIAGQMANKPKPNYIPDVRPMPGFAQRMPMSQRQPMQMMQPNATLDNMITNQAPIAPQYREIYPQRPMPGSVIDAEKYLNFNGPRYGLPRFNQPLEAPYSYDM